MTSPRLAYPHVSFSVQRFFFWADLRHEKAAPLLPLPVAPGCQGRGMGKKGIGWAKLGWMDGAGSTGTLAMATSRRSGRTPVVPVRKRGYR